MVGLGSAGADEPEPGLGVAGAGSRPGSGKQQASRLRARSTGRSLFLLGNLVGALHIEKSAGAGALCADMGGSQFPCARDPGRALWCLAPAGWCLSFYL
jgi:hypothetical protein